MSANRKRRCCICGQGFSADPRVGARQRACSMPACQIARRSQTQARWRADHPDYFIAYRMEDRNGKAEDRKAENPPPPVRVPPPLNRLPWDVAKDHFGPQGADFLRVMGRLLLTVEKDQILIQVIDSASVPGTLPSTDSTVAKDQIRNSPILAVAATPPYATGVSPTGPAPGAPPAPPPGPSPPPAGLAS